VEYPWGSEGGDLDGTREHRGEGGRASRELSGGAVGSGAAQEGQTPRSVRACRLAGLGPPDGEPVRGRARQTTRLRTQARKGVPSSGAGPCTHHRLRKRSPEYALLEGERMDQGTCSITVRGGKGVKAAGFAAHVKPCDMIVVGSGRADPWRRFMPLRGNGGRVRATSTLHAKPEGATPTVEETR
jgi:hypothetical protein